MTDPSKILSEYELQRRLELIENAIEALPVGFVLFDRDDKLVIKNSKYNVTDDSGVLEQPGTSFEEWVRFGLNVGAISENGEDLEAWVSERILRHQNPQKKVVQDLNDGRTVQVEEARTKDGGVVGAYTNVTDLRTIELALKNSQETLRQVSSSFPGIIFQYKTDDQGKPMFQFISEQCRDMLGASSDEIYKDFSLSRRYVVPEDRDKLEGVISAAVAAEASWVCECRVERNRQIRWLRSTSTAMKQPDGTTAWNGVIVDITSQKEIERELEEVRKGLEIKVQERTRDLTNQINERITIENELRKSKEIAETASRAKSHFLANMSHELRTPFNAILGMSEMMSSEILGPINNRRYQEYAQDINQAAGHLLQVINDILDLTRVESGNMELEQAKVKIVDLVASSTRIFREHFERSNVQFHLQLEDDLPDLWIDETRIRQVLVNLIGNAIKFSKPTGIIELTVGIAGGGDVEFSVADTGIGVSEADLAKVFEPFRQVASVLERDHQGTGLGLPIARELVELHGGALRLESRVDEGTTVSFTIPKARIM